MNFDEWFASFDFTGTRVVHDDGEFTLTGQRRDDDAYVLSARVDARKKRAPRDWVLGEEVEFSLASVTRGAFGPLPREQLIVRDDADARARASLSSLCRGNPLYSAFLEVIAPALDGTLAHWLQYIAPPAFLELDWERTLVDTDFGQVSLKMTRAFVEEERLDAAVLAEYILPPMDTQPLECTLYLVSGDLCFRPAPEAPDRVIAVWFEEVVSKLRAHLVEDPEEVPDFGDLDFFAGLPALAVRAAR